MMFLITDISFTVIITKKMLRIFYVENNWFICFDYSGIMLAKVKILKINEFLVVMIRADVCKKKKKSKQKKILIYNSLMTVFWQMFLSP